MQLAIQSISISQTSVANEIGTLSTKVHSLRDDFKMFKQLCRWMKGEFDSVKKLISSREQSSSAPPIPPPADPVSSSGPSQARQQEEEAGPSGPSGVAEDRPSGKIVVEPAGPTGPQAVQKEPAGPSGPVKVVSGPTGSVVSEDVQSSVEELAVAPEAPEPSSLATPAPSSPPSSSTAPPAPPTFKQHVPRTISSPTPFPSEPHSSPIMPTIISTSISPSPPVIDPLVSSSAGASSSSGPSSAEASTILSPRSFLHPPTPPTSVTITPTNPQHASIFQNKFDDELERTTLISILAVASHVHRTDSSSPVSKKRKILKTLALSSEPMFPPLWYSLSVENRRRPIYCEYLQKCILANLFGIPFLNLTDHLNIVLPYCHLSKVDQLKIFQLAECKIEDQWAKGYKSLYSKYLLARLDSTSRQDHPLTLSEWFVFHHQALWGPVILKEIRITRCFQFYNDFCYLRKQPEVQFGQFYGALATLRSEGPINCPFIVDFTTLKMPGVVFLPKLSRVAFPPFRDWEKHYNQSALQLESLNSSLVRAGKPPLSAEAFLDLNSINPVQELFVQWAVRYSAFISLLKDLKDHQLFYPVTIAHFLQRASFGKSIHFRFTLDKDHVISKHPSLPAKNFLRAFAPILFPIFQNPPLFNSMTVSGVSGTVGGYGTAFLTAEQQERFATVKTTLCGNKAVDVADLEKNRMHRVVAAIQRMKWSKMVTISEVSYSDLVKAFYVCLKFEEDGSLTSSVKGTPIHITYDLLASLFGVSTAGHSGVNTVDIRTKGLGIIGPEYKLKDGKIDINQLNTFNQILHFIVCQMLVPRSATFSSCPKADSDMMFWAIQNQEINLAEVIIERMKLASAVIWDKKNKLKVSLPYAHLLIKIFQHYNAEAAAVPPAAVQQEAVRAEIPEIQEEQAAAATAEISVEVQEASGSRIEDIPIEYIEPVGQVEEVVTPTSMVASILRGVLDSITSTQGEPEMGGDQIAKVMALGHNEDILMEDAPSQGEHVAEKEAELQGEHTANSPVVQFQEGVVESTSNEENVEPVSRASEKGKEVAPEIRLLTKKPHQRLKKKKKLKVNMKPINDRLDEQGKILCSVQLDIASIFISQSITAKHVGALTSELQSLKGELGSIKQVVQDLSVFVRAHLPIQVPLAPTPASNSGPSQEVEDVRPTRPTIDDESGPSGPMVVEEVVRPSGPIEAEQSGSPGPILDESGPSGPVESEAILARADEDQAVAPEPSSSSPLPTPAPPSPPSSSTTPPAPAPFKQPLPQNIYSPTPFPITSSSPSSTTFIPPPPSEAPPASSSSAGASSSGSSSAGPSIPPSPPEYSFLHPSTPPSFVTIILESDQLEHVEIQDIKDEFEEAILRSVLQVSTHLHRVGSSSHVLKKRKLSSNPHVSSEPCFPPLWFSLSVITKNKPLYREYLQKTTFATIFGHPTLNLTNHLNVILPFTSLSKAEKSKIFSMAEAKSEEQWARGQKSLYNQFLRAQAARYPPRDHPLTLFEWFQILHKTTWGPFVQKEIRFIRHLQMYNDYCCIAGDPTSLKEIVESDSERGDTWLHAVDVVVFLLVRASRGVRSRLSNRPQHLRALYLPHLHQWIMECSCRV
ncbi:hypothetical protein Taro_021823 [Colocasia esculenta]|uniref:Putative plant transposon protein domain-containing protein n=1 Tax=Colocasia esculenta TaxID=4460 RepID=A0A843UZV4_COLES|nr:hypothetical protein [Colocasia esculenta]